MNNPDLNERFQKLKKVPSDIRDHLQTLYDYANKEEVKTVIEFGTRKGLSTIALLAANPNKLISYDIVRHKIVNYLERFDNFQFINESSLETEIEETDLLFIDSLHRYQQLIVELTKHSNKVKHYIIMHDTQSFGKQDEGRKHYNGKKGLQLAIDEFLKKDDGLNWEIKEVYTNCNGLTVIQRKQHD